MTPAGRDYTHRVQINGKHAMMIIVSSELRAEKYLQLEGIRGEVDHLYGRITFELVETKVGE